MRKDTIKIQKINEPRDPEIVLFGLIFESFGPLNNFPKKNPPMSDAIQPSRIEIRNILS